MTGNEFLEALEADFELSAADRVLAEAIARQVDAAKSTKSGRDVRSTDRLIGELIRTLYSRQDVSETNDPNVRSTAARRMALARWQGAA